MDTTKMRKCSKCHRVLPATNEFFCNDSSRKGGLYNRCKDCKKVDTHEYRQSSKGKVAFRNANNRRRQQEKKGKGVNVEQYNEMFKFFDYKCAYSGLPLTTDTAELEHVVPLSKGGENEVWNIVPSNPSVNRSKHDHNMEDWYSKQEYFDEERLLKIYEWMQYASKKYCK